MDAVQLAFVGVLTNNIGILLVGGGLLCVGVGSGWWWIRARRERSEQQRRADERNTPPRGEESERSAETRPDRDRSTGETDDTGGFVFDEEPDRRQRE